MYEISWKFKDLDENVAPFEVLQTVDAPATTLTITEVVINGEPVPIAAG
jgi:hypothetical protein